MAEETLEMMLSSITTVWAQECVNKAKGILKRYDIKEGNLLPLTIESKQTKIGNGIRIDFYAADYYIYVDQGVKGIGVSGQQAYNYLSGNPKDKTRKKRSTSPIRQAITTGRFKYKNTNVSKAMVDNIQNWISRKGVQVRTKEDKDGKLVIKKSFNLAYAIAKSVKRTGIGKTMFWSDTFNEKAYQDLADRIAKKLGGDFTIQLRGL